MDSSATFKVTPSHGAVLENTRINFGKLYLRQIIGEPNKNQLTIIEGEKGTEFGLTAVNNWAIFDGAGADAKLVARAKGMHMNASVDWYNSFIMVFETERFKKSTLEVMGLSFNGEQEGEWAIVGGTGAFARARGVIKRSIHGSTQELTIDAFGHMKLPPPEKFGPWGNKQGTPRDITGVPQRLESLTIQVDDGTKGVNTISFTYFDEAGRRRTGGPWGPAVGHNNKITFGPSEVVTGISGTTWTRGHTGFTSLKISTNVDEYGPFGVPEKADLPFSIAIPEDKTVVAFFGTSDRFLNSFGAYVV